MDTHPSYKLCFIRTVQGKFVIGSRDNKLYKVQQCPVNSSMICQSDEVNVHVQGWQWHSAVTAQGDYARLITEQLKKKSNDVTVFPFK